MAAHSWWSRTQAGPRRWYCRRRDLTKAGPLGRAATYKDLCEVPDHLIAEILEIYAREGVCHVWLVEPIKRTLEVLRLTDGRWMPLATLKDDAVAEVEPFDAIAFPLTRIWPELQIPQADSFQARRRLFAITDPTTLLSHLFGCPVRQG